MQLFARQGDLVINKVLVEGNLTPTTNLVLAGGSSGHTHTIEGACLHRRDGDITYVCLSEERTLTHARADGHASIVLPPGSYEIKRLRERGDASDRNVED